MHRGTFAGKIDGKIVRQHFYEGQSPPALELFFGTQDGFGNRFQRIYFFRIGQIYHFDFKLGTIDFQK